jgi:hypothetical protein
MADAKEVESGAAEKAAVEVNRPEATPADLMEDRLDDPLPTDTKKPVLDETPDLNKDRLNEAPPSEPKDAGLPQAPPKKPSKLKAWWTGLELDVSTVLIMLK